MLVAGCRDTHGFRDAFETTPFAAGTARWCERYHHAHHVPGAIELMRSTSAVDECGAGGESRALSCVAPGCDTCACTPPCSPCAKIGDPNGNAVLVTTADTVGANRVALATFTVVRQLPSDSHIGLYVAIHPHCHTTVQGLLVADRPGEFHLNVAAFNQFIGGDRAAYPECARDPFEEISPALATGIALAEGSTYTWELAADLVGDGVVEVASTVRAADGTLLGHGSHTFHAPGAVRWFGVAGAAARYGFGAQYTLAPSPSGGEPLLRLEEFAARP